ncbi:MAG: hypothetical protein R3302_05685 [Sulfurimonadaceae bacterium]|nr:hypothetical protein [Sulfurimonadaceae bacterium]
MEQALKEKLEKIVELVYNLMVDPDIDIEYCIPEVATTTESCDVGGEPHLLVKYAEDNYVTRKVRLDKDTMTKSPEAIAAYVTDNIKEFKEEIDGVKLGAG